MDTIGLLFEAIAMKKRCVGNREWGQIFQQASIPPANASSMRLVVSSRVNPAAFGSHRWTQHQAVAHAVHRGKPQPMLQQSHSYPTGVRSGNKRSRAIVG